MPKYTYTCPRCVKSVVEVRPPERMNEPAPCVDCGGDMPHDLVADLRTLAVHTERDTNDYAIEKHVAQVHSGRQVTSRRLAQSLAHVPGIPKVKGPDGRVRAVFRNSKHRAKVLGKLGIQSD